MPGARPALDRVAVRSVACGPCDVPVREGRAGPPDEDEELRTAVAAVVRMLAEVLGGTREPRRLSWWATPDVCAAAAGHRVPVAAGAKVAPPRVLRTWAQQAVPDVAETGAVVVLDGRVRALALRLELWHGRWRCTALETAGHRARLMSRAG